jgi:hypothetical protein
VRSDSPFTATRLGALLAVCGLLLTAGALSGCSTTQETAARKQAESKRFLEEREGRREQRSKSEQSRKKG